MNPDPLHTGASEIGGRLGRAAFSHSSDGYVQPVSHASIAAAERTCALLQSVGNILFDRLDPTRCLVASQPNASSGELYRMVVGCDQNEMKFVLQRIHGVQIYRSQGDISSFDLRQAMLRNLREVHLYELPETAQREDRREEFVRLSSVDIEGRSFRANNSAITDPISPWSELTAVLTLTQSQPQALTVVRSDPHKTVNAQTMRLEFTDGHIDVNNISFPGGEHSPHGVIYRPQLELLCERELPRLCNWVEHVLTCDNPWVEVAKPIDCFL